MLGQIIVFFVWYSTVGLLGPQWLRANGYGWGEDTCFRAAEGGYPAVPQ